MKNDQSEEFYKRENFVLNSLINFEPVKRFKNRRNVMQQHEQQHLEQVADA